MKTINLRDVQELIDRGEFRKNPKYKWLWETRELQFCQDDGTILSETGRCELPTHPYPKPNPYRREHPYIIALLVVALVYSVSNNGAISTLITSVTLLLFSLVLFGLLLWLLIYLKFGDEESGDKRIRTIVSFVAAALAMVTVAVMSDEMPDLSWWMIELGIGYTLDLYLGYGISRWARRGEVKRVTTG